MNMRDATEMHTSISLVSDDCENELNGVKWTEGVEF